MNGGDMTKTKMVEDFIRRQGGRGCTLREISRALNMPMAGARAIVDSMPRSVPIYSENETETGFEKKKGAPPARFFILGN